MAEKYCDIEYRKCLISIKEHKFINYKSNYFSFTLKSEDKALRHSIRRYPDLLSVISRAIKDIDIILGEGDKFYFEGARELFEVTYKYHRLEVWEFKDGSHSYSGYSDDPNFTENHEDYASVIESFRTDVNGKLAEEKTTR